MDKTKTPSFHGMTLTPEYEAWRQMKKRCLNKSHKSYNLYGGRGIKVCKRWINSFKNFYEDMGARPSKIHSLDRINNSYGYSKSNCRWATPREQQGNKRTCVRVVLFGEKFYLEEAIRLFSDLKKVTVHQRIRLGWPVLSALIEPKIYRG